jgi:hypothetical protein
MGVLCFKVSMLQWSAMVWFIVGDNRAYVRAVCVFMCVCVPTCDCVCVSVCLLSEIICISAFCVSTSVRKYMRVLVRVCTYSVTTDDMIEISHTYTTQKYSIISWNQRILSSEFPPISIYYSVEIGVWVSGRNERKSKSLWLV